MRGLDNERWGIKEKDMISNVTSIVVEMLENQGGRGGGYAKRATHVPRWSRKLS